MKLTQHQGVCITLEGGKVNFERRQNLEND